MRRFVLALVFVLYAGTAWAQGTFIRTICNDIPASLRVEGHTWCEEASTLSIKVWHLGAWVPISGGGFPNATYLTVNNELVDLPNSRRLLAGTNITFDDTTPGVRTVNAAGGGGGGGACGVAGLVNISGASTTGSVVFGSAMADTTYAVTLGTNSSAGAPDGILVWYKNKTVNGFDLELTAAPGLGNTVTVNWMAGVSCISGTGAANQITVWSGASSLTGFTDFTWNDTTKVLDAGPTNTLVGATQTWVVGQNNTVDGTAIYVHGSLNNMTGAFDSGAWGEGHTVSGLDSWTVGENNTISGFNSNAFGQANNVSGFDSTAVGEVNTISGDDSYAFGETNTVAGASSMAVGIDNNDGAIDGAFIFGRNVDLTGGVFAGDVVALGVSATPEILIVTGTIAFNGAIAAGSATGKRVLCIDNTTKVIYISSTGTDCTN